MVPSELTLMFVIASSFNGAWGGENPLCDTHQGAVNHQPFTIGQLIPDFEKGHYVNLSLFRARNKDYKILTLMSTCMNMLMGSVQSL